MFFEALTHAMALDFGFFIGLVLNNLFWVFGFYAIMFYFFNGKKTLYFTIFFALIVWAYSDMQAITNIVWTSASFLLFYYISKLALLKIAETIPRISKYMVVLSTAQGLLLFLVFNFLIK
ncbi:MAG: hypothetical protein HYW50_01225 [Candidatus Diapherotrites archaeon]|nr:hypothetical protein [Candidatus Diapherotrites archaeon]